MGTGILRRGAGWLLLCPVLGLAAGTDGVAAEPAPRVVVRYRFRDLRMALDAAHEQCREQALRHWCVGHVHPKERDRCTRELLANEGHFVTRSFVLASTPVLRTLGSSVSHRFSFPWRCSASPTPSPSGPSTGHGGRAARPAAGRLCLCGAAVRRCAGYNRPAPSHLART
jgi:hypothetical protein